MLNKKNEEILKNGIKWYSYNRDYTDTVCITLSIKGGLFLEPVNKNGIGTLFVRTWLRSGNLMEIAEFNGASFNGGVSTDFIEFTLAVPSSKLSSMINDINKQLYDTVLDKVIFNNEKEILLGELEYEKDDPNTLAYQKLMQSTYGNHPYSLSVNGTIPTVKNIEFEDILNYKQSVFNAAESYISMVGNFDKSTENKLKTIFEKINYNKILEVESLNSYISENHISYDTDNRIQQAKLFIAYDAPAASHSDYIKVKVLNEMLGGGMSSLYFNVLRKDKGYAYSVGSIYSSRLQSSRLIGYIALKAENIDSAINIMTDINKSIFDNLNEDDFQRAKNHIVGQILLESEANHNQAWYSNFFALLGLSFNFKDQYVSELNKMNISELKEVDYIFEKPRTIYIYKPE